MKRWLALLFSVCLVLTLCACPDGGGGDIPLPQETPLPTAYAAYLQAGTTVSDAGGYYATDTRALFSIDSTSSVNIHHTVTYAGGEHEMYSWFSNEGAVQEISLYYAGGMAYFSVNDDTGRCPAGEDEYHAMYIAGKTADPALLGLRQADLANARVVRELGGYSLVVRISHGAGSAAYLRGVLGETAYRMYAAAEKEPEVRYTFRFKEGGVLYAVNTEFSMVFDGATIDVSTATQYRGVGETVTVTPPDGANAWQVVSRLPAM